PHMLPQPLLPPPRRRLSPRRRRMLDNAPDLVRRPASYLEIDPRLDLGHHPEQDEKDARKTDRRREHWQRRLNERDAKTVFENQCPGEDQRREAQKPEPNLAEKLDRPIKGSVDKVHDQEIQHDPGDPAEPVFRFAKETRVMDHRE